jgi:hypothetical protein
MPEGLPNLLTLTRPWPKQRRIPKAKASRRGKTSKAKASTKAERAFLKKRIYQRIFMRKYRARKKKEAKA